MWGLEADSTVIAAATLVRTSPREPNAPSWPVFAEFWAGGGGGKGQAFSCPAPAVGNGPSPGFLWILQSWRALLLAAEPRAARKPQKTLENKDNKHALNLLPAGSIPNQNEK